jgi:NAD(P)-dependent dehydrogenase (short-subunit alcohol dehydrogenase family)
MPLAISALAQTVRIPTGCASGVDGFSLDLAGRTCESDPAGGPALGRARAGVDPGLGTCCRCRSPLPARSAHPGAAYSMTRRANVRRVQAAAPVWGQRGAPVNSISRSVISTPMGQQALDSPVGGTMRAMIESSPAKRLGTPKHRRRGRLPTRPSGRLRHRDRPARAGGVVSAARTGWLAHLRLTPGE